MLATFKRGQRVYLAGWLISVVCTGFIKKDRLGNPFILVELDKSRARMWWPLDRVMQDFDL